jgi:hypothetical protein
VSWEIIANRGTHARAGVDARGWVWEITRDAQIAEVVIEISGVAWSSDLSHCPKTLGERSRPTDVPSY